MAPATVSLDVLFNIVKQVKEYYCEPPWKHQRGRPLTFSGLAFLLLAVEAVVLHTFKPQDLLSQALGLVQVPHRCTVERRQEDTLPETEGQVQALGPHIPVEVEPGPA